MSDERFKLCDGVKLGTHSGVWDNHKQNHQRTGDELWIGEVIGMLNELASENEELRKERDYWEQSSSHRKRLLEDSEKELRLHNAYLIDNNQAEDYQRWRRSNK